MQVRHAYIQLSNKEAVDAIRNQQPTSMSWSNVADYMVMQVGMLGIGHSGQTVCLLKHVNAHTQHCEH